MFQKQFQPVPIVQKDSSELYAVTADIFHVHHLYLDVQEFQTLWLSC